MPRALEVFAATSKAYKAAVSNTRDWHVHHTFEGLNATTHIPLHCPPTHRPSTTGESRSTSTNLQRGWRLDEKIDRVQLRLRSLPAWALLLLVAERAPHLQQRHHSRSRSSQSQTQLQPQPQPEDETQPAPQPYQPLSRKGASKEAQALLPTFLTKDARMLPEYFIHRVYFEYFKHLDL